MIIRFFKFTKLPQMVAAIVVSLIIMLAIKNQNISANDFYLLLILALIFLLSLFIISKNSILKNNQFTTLGLILFSAAYFKMPSQINVVISYLFLLFSVRKIYSLKSQKDASKKLIDIGFWLAFSLFFHPINILFLFTIISGLFVFYKITIDVIFKVLVGFITAVLMIVFTAHLIKNLEFDFNSLMLQLKLLIISFDTNFLNINNDFFHWIPAVITAFLVANYTFNYFGNNLTERIRNTFLLIFSLNSLLFAFIINEYSIFLFFPFLVTLIKTISELKINLLTETLIIAVIIISCYPF